MARVKCEPRPHSSYNALARGIEDAVRNSGRAHLSLQISIRESGEIAVVAINGRLVIGEPSERLHEALRELANRGLLRIVVNLEGVPQIDSSGISILVRNSITLLRSGGGLRLVCGPGRVRDALSVTRLTEAIPTFDSDSAAVASLS